MVFDGELAKFQIVHHFTPLITTFYCFFCDGGPGVKEFPWFLSPTKKKPHLSRCGFYRFRRLIFRTYMLSLPTMSKDQERNLFKMYGEWKSDVKLNDEVVIGSVRAESDPRLD